MTDELLEPIRAELFSIERLEQHAESLAAAQTLAPKKTRGRRLLPRVKDNAGRAARVGYRDIAQAIHEERVITPAAEWLVDNFHIVEEQIREIIDDLPPGYYKELPKLAAGHLEGYPRIFGVAWAFVAHTDSRLDPDWLRRFVKAYQRPEALHIGEVWALAISLRMILVENLRRMTERIVASKVARQKANELADALLGLKGANAAPDLTTFENAARSRAFAVQLVQRLRDQEGRRGAGAAMAGPAARPAANHGRRYRAPGTSGAGRHEHHGAQCHHQHAHAVRDGLGAVLRRCFRRR